MTGKKRTIKKSPRPNKILPIIIIILAAALIRLYNLTLIPPGFHRDEAYFGYEAYSILQTARDEHGKFLPLSFEGFGIIDYPLAIYLRVPFIFLLGLNIFSVRASVVFYSLLTIFLIYKLAQKIFRDEKTALFSAILVAFSTWHFFMSRTGYTISMFALMFLLAGVYLLLFQKHKYHNILGGISLGLTCFTYAAYFFFMPLFLILIFLCFHKDIKIDKNKKYGLVAATIVVIAAFLLFWGPNVKRAPQSAFFLTDRGLIFEWSDKPVGELLAQGKSYNKMEWFLHNPRFAYIYKAANNYFDGFSHTYWLKKGVGFESNVQGFGNLLLYEPVLILMGACFLLYQRSKYALFLIGWILIGPIATTFTKDVASTRLLQMLPPMILLQAAAIKNIWDFLSKAKSKIIMFSATTLFALPILYINLLYYDAYFNHMGAYAGKWWYRGYLDVVNLTNQFPQKTVYLKGKGDLAYVFILFQNKYDPALFQKTAVRETTGLNINTVSSFGRYNLVDEIRQDQLCADYNSIFIQKQESEKDLIFTPDGTINHLGSDKFIYFIPTKDKCEAGK